MNDHAPFIWQIQRLAGIDHICLDSGSSLFHLKHLDPKVWGALSCPVAGLNFDERTLALIDSDADGRIRIPEVLHAVEWVCQRLADPSNLISPEKALPLSAINTATSEGVRLRKTAEAVLALQPDSGKADAITAGSIKPAADTIAQNLFNGDGIFPLHTSLDPEVQPLVEYALATTGGVTDASGKPGVSSEIVDSFMESLHQWQRWHEKVAAAAQVLGDNTPEAWEELQALSEKIDDYFLRCSLAEYAPGAASVLNPDEKTFLTENGRLDEEKLLALPLAAIGQHKPLQANASINPAYTQEFSRFMTLIRPLLSEPDILSLEEWRNVQKHFTGYAAALEDKPAPVLPKVSIAPVSQLAEIPPVKVAELLEGKAAARFRELVEQDKAVPLASADITDLERLVLYYGNIHRLLHNFVSFYDFYATGEHAVFQEGTLFIDGRGCRLCLPVSDIEQHAELASRGGMFLLYCECSRKDETTAPTTKKRNIVAAVTAGNADLLLKGRNGVFVDYEGNDWDATVIKVVNNPISIRQAIWDPYKRFGRMAAEQINKFAAAKDTNLISTAGSKIAGVAENAGTSAPKFDLGRSVGVFAAVGLALGAIGTALGSLASAFFSLDWWQVPLVFIGLFLIISGPSVVLAWLKLRKRTLGPLLEASGWAVNSWLPVNLPLAGRLTAMASLPGNFTRNYSDPLRARKNRWPFFVLFFFLLAGLIAGVCLYSNKEGIKPSALLKELIPGNEQPQDKK